MAAINSFWMTFWKISKSGHFFNLFKHKLQLWIFHNPKWIKISQNKLQKIILNKKDLRIQVLKRQFLVSYWVFLGCSLAISSQNFDKDSTAPSANHIVAATATANQIACFKHQFECGHPTYFVFLFWLVFLKFFFVLS